MASSSKRARSSSTGENFLSKDNEKAYDRYSACKISHSRILIQSDINFDVLPLFSTTKLQFILTHPYAYNLETFLQFLANMRITPESTRLSSFVLQQRVQITKEDLGKYLHLRTEGVRAHSMSLESEYNWTAVNQVLRGLDQICHLPRVYTLNQNARIIQHVLRSTVIPKAGDRINMTPLLSCVTYLIMTDTPFDEAQLILDYLQSLTDIRHPSTKRKKNIALGHLVCYVLEKKYSLIYPNPPTEEPIFFTNASFRALFSHGSDSGGEEEQEPQGAPAPVLAPAQDQNAFQDLAQRFGQLETHFDQRFDQLENRLDAHINQYNADMDWMRGQSDYINTNLASINSYFTAFAPQPPPDQGPNFLDMFVLVVFIQSFVM
ncbi:hypothetical protein M5K25_021061 [Dendrobium thyrsiflorum]|uniref:Uncharacterized protein n=1 Tax=Dendrobium thyrsiflorum TaxID=117978 RepID=A0ABD0UIF8_DENTH